MTGGTPMTYETSICSSGWVGLPTYTWGMVFSLSPLEHRLTSVASASTSDSSFSHRRGGVGNWICWDFWGLQLKLGCKYQLYNSLWKDLPDPCFMKFWGSWTQTMPTKNMDQHEIFEYSANCQLISVRGFCGLSAHGSFHESHVSYLCSKNWAWYIII